MTTSDARARVRNLMQKVTWQLARFRPVPRQAIRTMRGGYRMALCPTSDPHERHLYAFRTYEAGTLALMDRVLRHGDTIVDVGANLGLMTLHAATLVGPDGLVIALEPHPPLFQRLCDNVALNGLRNVRPLCVGAASVAGRQHLFVPSQGVGRASLVRPVAPHETAEIDVSTLDEIVGSFPVRFLKVDVEGFEADVLKGASRMLSVLRPVICIEVSAAVEHVGEPLAAHDLIMRTGLYKSFNFRFGKEIDARLVEITNRDSLLKRRHDNVVYIPSDLEPTLPAELF